MSAATTFTATTCTRAPARRKRSALELRAASDVTTVVAVTSHRRHVGGGTEQWGARHWAETKKA